MAHFRTVLSTKLASCVDWFIPPQLKTSRDLMQGMRMFMFSHMFGPFLGNTISLAMFVLRGEADASWWVFFCAVTAFWLFPPVLRLTGWYVPLALLSIENLIFCVFWGCYQYGGVSSPIMPWLVTVPLLAFFYLPERRTRIVISIQIVGSLAAFFTIYSTIGFPVQVPLEGLGALGIVSTLCASIYVSMMALFYANTVSSQAELEREIQHHKATEAQLRDATAQIEQAMTAKSEFLAKMSHELRNPLNSIIGYSEILLESVSDTESQRGQDLGSIRSAGKKLLELINDLLDLAKLEAGKMGLHVEQTDLRVLFDELAAEWSTPIEAKGNVFRLRPPASVDISCDVGKVRRIVSNLLSNAAKFTDNGQVTFSAARQAGMLTFTVEDTGIGIARETLPVIFETFGNASDETASNYGDDVRLGLPLAQRYCRLLGGDLQVDSTLGAGSRFVVRLPDEALKAPADIESDAQPERQAA